MGCKKTRDTKLVPINYTSREFGTIKNELVNYAKRYYPDTFKDFNEAGFGALFLDTMAYIGDILSFYLDFQANESFLDTALEYDNIIKLGRQMGYKFRGNPSSCGFATFYVLVPASTNGLGPDRRYLPILKRGSEFKSKGGVGFLLNQDVNFKHSDNEVIVAQVDDTTGTPITYAVKAIGEVVSGELGEDVIAVPSFKKFLRVSLSSAHIVEVLTVRDTEGHRYYEVDHLSQNVVYRSVVNKNSATDNVRTLLRPFVVPRRFVVEQDRRRRTFLQFGYGSETQLTTDAVADPRTVVLKENGKDYNIDPSFDPSKLVESDKFGIAPANTKLTIRYRTNTKDNVNVAASKLTKVSRPLFRFDNLSSLNNANVQFVVNSLEVNNDDPIIGDVTFQSTEELKRRIYDHYASQNRAVTKQDYVSTVYSMPPQNGAIKRAAIVRDDDSFKRNLNLYLISENADGTLTEPTATLKKNVKIWLNKNRMINDTVDILNARILNISIDFVIIADLEFSRFDTLASAVTELRRKIKIPDIGGAFYISDIYKILNDVDGVLDVHSVRVRQKTGASYADLDFDVLAHMSPDGRYFTVPEDVIAEVKYPLQDIKGVIK